MNARNDILINYETYDEVEEFWKPIPSFPRWDASNLGNIRNHKRGNILKPHLDKDGYEIVSLGNTNNLSVHRLVAETFLERTEGRNQVNHINAVKADNSIYNLEWCTRSENIRHAIEHGLQHPIDHLEGCAERNRKKVMIDETGEVFDSVRDLASYFRISSTNVSRVLSGSRRGQRIHGVHIREVDERFENDHQS